MPPESYRVGDPFEGACAMCESATATHMVLAVDDGRVVRVQCDQCGTRRNHGAGPRPVLAPVEQPGRRRTTAATTPRGPAPIVDPRERRYPAVNPEQLANSTQELELLLRRVIREETGVTAVVPAERWRGGEFVVRSAREGVQEKSWPIETFFAKIVGVRNRLRTLEQQINAADLPAETKVKIQSYITGCYGSLTSFNVLFADEDDRFRGQSGKG